jgi:hypothetical protein
VTISRSSKLSDQAPAAHQLARLQGGRLPFRGLHGVDAALAEVELVCANVRVSLSVMEKAAARSIS